MGWFFFKHALDIFCIGVKLINYLVHFILETQIANMIWQAIGTPKSSLLVEGQQECKTHALH